MLLETQNTFKNFFRRLKTLEQNNRLAFFLFAALLIANAGLLRWIMLFGWDPQDYGGLLNGAWRILLGQKVYVDFYFHTVPMQLYILAAFLGLFGFGKTALWAALIFDSTLAGLLVFFGSKRLKLPNSFCLLAVLVTLLGFHSSRAFPLYDHYAPLFGLCSIWTLALFYPSRKGLHAFMIHFVIGLFVVLAILTKPMDGGAFGLMFLVMSLAVKPYRKEAFTGYFLGCLTGSIAALLFFIPNFYEFLHQNISYGATQTGRWKNFLSMRNLLAHGYFIPLTILFSTIKNPFKQNYVSTLLAIGATFAAIFSFTLGSERALVHIPLMGTIIALALAILWSEFQNEKAFSDGKKIRLGIFLMIMFCVVQIILGIADGTLRRQSNCRHHHYGPCYDYSLTTKPLDGWKVYTNWGKALDNMTEYVQKTVPANDSFLILTNLQTLDLLTRREPYRGIPFQFNINVAPSPGKEVERVRQNIMKNPPQWILTYKDTSPFGLNALLVYLGLEDFLLNKYTPVWSYGGYFLCTKRLLPPQHEIKPCYPDGTCPNSLQDALTNWLSQ